MDRTLLERKSLAELKTIAGTLELRGYQRMRKADLIDLILETGGAGQGAPASGSAASEPRAPEEPGPSSGAAGAGGTGVATSTGEATEPAAGDGATSRARTRARRRDTEVESPATDRGGAGRPAARDAGEGARTRSDAGTGHAAEGPAAEPRPGDARPSDARQGDAGPADERPADEDTADARSRAKRDRRRKGRGAPVTHGHEGGDDAEVREGVLDLLPEGYGFLRVTGFLSGNLDVYVSQSFVRRYELRRGDRVSGPIRRNKNSDKFPALARVDTIEGEPVTEERGVRVDFADLTPVFPDERLRLEVDAASPASMRLVDLLAPIGKGQRGLLVSPPKAGKSTLLKQLAQAIEANDPDVHLMVLLVDERPEEVTDLERSTAGEVISSTFDRPAEDHTQVAELAIERAKRLVERGRDVVVLLDSITRLGRAYNQVVPPSGRVLSGGVDSAALYPPKRFLGAARNIEDGGSLTIIATAAIETGSRMDEVIFEELKGTGNMELRLDSRLEQKRIFPAIDVLGSGTRREEALLAAEDLAVVWKLRRLLATMDAEAALQLLLDKLQAADSNAQLLQQLSGSSLD